MISLPIASMLVFLAVSPALAENITLVQKSSGKAIQVFLLEQTENSVKIRNNAGQVFTIELSQLTQETVDTIKKIAVTKAEQAKNKHKAVFDKANLAVGHKLFDQKNLWQETGASIADRLKWKRESIKKGSSSYRMYTPKDYKFLGAHPYCVSLYGGENDKPERLSLVYANKGDFGSRLGMGPDHFRQLHPESKPPKTLDEAIEADAEFISKALTTALGEPKKQYYGERQDRRKVLRWDAAEQSFLLSVLEEEYVHLLIVPTSNADVEGKVKFVKDSDLRKLQLANVQKNDNGDVWIDNIPMVNQGPKGYCAPATLERAMRYMRVPADMYLLATAATKPQGGTNTRKLMEDCKNIVRSKARRIKDLKLEDDLTIKAIKRYIDKGVPIMWRMRSLPAYNKIANTRSQQRLNITDFNKWKSEIAAEAESILPQLNINDNHHICMIIGYNTNTNELAVSDSWGPRYELRWIHTEIAEAITTGNSYIIDF